MMQINLLPWRERRHDAIKRTFISQILLSVMIAAIVVFATSEFFAQQLAQLLTGVCWQIDSHPEVSSWMNCLYTVAHHKVLVKRR
ncbi:MAG TPA: hypothetical protein DCS79_09160 [Gammaproteobacteria bacterium]|nr:hypothetical protein [Gammaproteobacteria bacterium]